MNVLGGLNDSHITKEDVQGAVHEMKVGRTVDLNRCAVKCLESSGACVIEWLVRLLNVYFVTSMLPVDGASA